MVEQIKVFGVERRIQFRKGSNVSDDDLKDVEGRCGDNCEHGWFDSVVKNTKLHYRKWLPVGKPKAIIICAHGSHSHSGTAVITPDGKKYRSALRSEKLNGEGYAVYAHDNYGHGYSEGTRWLIPNTWKNNLADYCNFVNLVAKQHESDIPIFLFGESYGGTLSIHLARQFQDRPETGPKIESVILSAPALDFKLPPLPLLMLFRYVGAPLFPRWRAFMPKPYAPRDPEIHGLKLRDPAADIQLDGNGTPPRMGTAANLLKTLEKARERAIPGFCVPYCLLHGTNDAACPISGADYMWATAKTPVSDREYHRLEGADHDIFGDPVAEDAMQIVLDWIKKRLVLKAHREKSN